MSEETDSERCYAVRAAAHGLSYQPRVPARFDLTLEEAEEEAGRWRSYADTVGGDAIIVKQGGMIVGRGKTYGPVRLYNRADGVKGHYCIGREVIATDGLRHHEFWHTSRFCSAGEVVIGEEAAKAKLVDVVQRLASQTSD